MARSMKCVVCIVTLTLSLVASFPIEDIVVYNSSDELQTAITENNTFVLFCAPKSNNCQRITPIWDELHQLYRGDHSFVKLAQVVCSEETELCADQRVKNVPLCRFFYKDSDDFTDFRGRRTFESLHRFVEDEIHNVEDITEAPVPDAVIELGAGRFEYFVSERLHFINFYTPWCGHCKVLSPVWHDLALAVGGDVHLFISQVDCSRHGPLCAQHSIKAFPSLVLFHNGQKVDTYTGNRGLWDLKDYIQSKMDQLVEEPIPEVKTENGVVVLTTESFSHVVNNNLVFVNFYTPWCVQCKELNPVWEQLAETNKDRGLMLASVDCEQYSYICDMRSVTIYPTLMLYQSGMHLYDYYGNLTLAELQNTIDQFTGKSHEEL